MCWSESIKHSHQSRQYEYCYTNHIEIHFLHSHLYKYIHGFRFDYYRERLVNKCPSLQHIHRYLKEKCNWSYSIIFRGRITSFKQITFTISPISSISRSTFTLVRPSCVHTWSMTMAICSSFRTFIGIFKFKQSQMWKTFTLTTKLVQLYSRTRFLVQKTWVVLNDLISDWLVSYRFSKYNNKNTKKNPQ
jgi:hypothetical protein